MCSGKVNSSFLDGGEPHKTIFPPAYLTASCTSLRTMTSNNALDSADSYAIAWIAALPIERAAAEAMLDEEHAAPIGFTRYQTDANVNTGGRVGEHNIVIASLASRVQKAPGSIQFNWRSIRPRGNTSVVVIPLGARLSFLHRFFGQNLHCVLGEEIAKTRPDNCNSNGESIFRGQP
jgi:hypothetical protein